MKTKIPLQIVELEDKNYHLIATSVFHDGTTGNWVLDTGASKTVFHKKLTSFFWELEGEHEEIHSAGIGEQALETSLATLKPFRMGNYEVARLKVALLDLTHINRLYSKATNFEICGLIGSDFLLKHKAVIDYKRKVLILNT